MNLPHFEYEQTHWNNSTQNVIGIDEVGRGAFAGPVAVGAVVFPINFDQTDNYQDLADVRDSKKLTSLARTRLANIIRQHASHWAIGSCPADLIDRYGITHCLLIAAHQAIDTIKQCDPGISKYHILSDKCLVRKTHRYSNITEVTDGDTQCFSIAAASILAKVWRDHYMHHLGSQKHFKIYGWQDNAGYGTKNHQHAIRIYGPTLHHRQSFIENTLSPK